jgi:hypothetical protein
VSSPYPYSSAFPLSTFVSYSSHVFTYSFFLVLLPF